MGRSDPDNPPGPPEIEPAGNEPESSFRRRRRPVPVRQAWWRRHFRPLLWSGLGALALAGIGGGLRHWLLTSPSFVLASLEQIQVSGTRETSPEAVRQVFAADLGRNLLAIPLARRRQALERMPWIAQAAVMRLWPNRLAVQVAERRPVAFARQGTSLALIAADGTLLPRVAGLHFQGAMLTGLALDANAAPAALLQQRREQMTQFLRLRQALDAGGAHRLRDFAEIDLSDPNDVRALAAPAGAGGRALLLQLGDRHFQLRYQLYRQHIQSWLAQYPGLRAVDLRYDGEAILNTGAGAVTTARPPDRPR